MTLYTSIEILVVIMQEVFPPGHDLPSQFPEDWSAAHTRNSAISSEVSLRMSTLSTLP